ncbi:MAG: hypothetical protein AAF533_18325 [Acidobacteriota bacterium]
MHDTDERRAALRLLRALEQGGEPAADLAIIAQDIDPVLVHGIISFLRAVYPATDPAATGVLGRVVELTGASPEVIRRHEEGGRDPITEWFTSEHEYGQFRGRGDNVVDLLVEKLES